MADGNAWDPQAFQQSGGTQSVAERAQAQPQQPTNALSNTAGNLKDQWDTFIDHPENRAGMMQFAVNMLSGKGFGESLGSAAEATGRSVTQQEADEKFEEQQALKERETGAYELTARAHMLQAQRGDPQERYYNQLAARDEAQAQRTGFDNYNKWLGSEDTGLDPYMSNIKTKYPSIKDKRQLIDPKTPDEVAAAREMQSRFMRPSWQPGGGGGGAPAARPTQQMPIPPKPTNVPNAQLMRGQDGRPVWYDPKTQLPAQ